MKWLRRAFSLGLLLSVPLAIAAPDRPRVSLQENEYLIPLGWLNGHSNEPLELRGADGRRNLDLPIPARLKVEEARIEMIYTNSISLLPRSQLAVALDERVIAQMPLKALQPDNGVRILLPNELLKPGYHTLGFRGAQHYTDQCEDPSAPELYSQIDTRQSVLRIRASRQAIRPSLARLGDIFDRRLWLDHYRLTLLMPQVAYSDATLREAAGQVAQAVAGLFEYIPVTVRAAALQSSAQPAGAPAGRFPGLMMPSAEGLQGWDVILLGTRDQLAPYLHPELLARITEGFIGVYPSDEDATRAVLVVSGATPEQVRMAATALNLPGLALPERAEVRLSELDLDRLQHESRFLAEKDGWTSFKQLGFGTTTMKGMYPRPATLEFRLPAQLEALGREPYFELELHVSYGAGFDKKSGLNVFFNDQFIKAIPMANPAGEMLRVQLKLPVAGLRSGTNRIQFIPSVIGQDVGGACEPIYTDNLLITVFDDSRIQLPKPEDLMALPDLALFARTGLPYTRYLDSRGTAIWLTETTPANLGHALNIVAKLRQVNRAPLFGMSFPASFEAQDDMKALIAIGTASQLPESLRKEMTAFLPGQRWQVFSLGAMKSLDLKSGFKSWIEQPLKPLAEAATVLRPAQGTLTLSEGLGESAAVVQFVSSNLDVPVTVITAAGETTLTQAVEQLVDDAVWGSMQGAAMLWSADGEVTAWSEPGSRHIIGDASSMRWMGLSLSEHPWLTTLVVIGLILAIAALTWWLLRRRAHAKGLDT